MHRIAVLFALGLVGCGGQAVVDGSAASGGGSGGTGGAGGHSSCAALEAEFGTAFAQAKQCDPFLSSPQCTLKFKSALTCGCSTYVNPGNSQALETLGEIETEWQTMGCDRPGLCPPSCPAPQGSACVQDSTSGSTGSCEDLFR